MSSSNPADPTGIAVSPPLQAQAPSPPQPHEPAPAAAAAPALSPAEERRQSRAPLLFGILGSRRSVDHGTIAAEVQTVLREYRDLLPSTPFLLLSPLTEAAEKAAVEGALQDVDAELVVVLPFPSSHHLALDPTHLSKTRYLDLTDLERSKVAGPVDAGESLSMLTRAFVARRCQILIAVGEDGPDAVRHVQQARMDVEEAGGVTTRDEQTETVFVPGSLAAMKRVKYTGQMEDQVAPALDILGKDFPELFGSPQDDPLESFDTGPVHVVPGGGPPLVPEESSGQADEYMERFKQILKKNLDRFNSQATTMSARTAAKWEQNRQWLHGDADQLGGGLQTLRNAFATADTLANQHQNWVKWSVRGALVLVFVAVLAFSAYAHLLHEPWAFAALGLYLLFLTAADAVYLLVFRRQDRQNIYQDYRTLAEGLRVQFSWSLAGIREAAADSYLHKQKNELQWIREAVKAQGLRASCRDGTTRRPTQGARQVLDKWVLNQFVYYRKSALRDGIKHLRWRQAAAGLLIASLLATLGAALWGVLSHPSGLPVLGSCVTLACLAAAGAVGLWHVVSKFRELGEETHQNQEELQQATEHSDRLKTPAGRAEELTGLGITIADFPKKPTFWLWRGISCAWWAILGFPRRPRFWWIITLGWLAVGFGGGVVLAWLLAGMEPRLLHWFGAGDHAAEAGRVIPHWLIVAIGVVVAAAALCLWYAEKRAYAEQHKQYRRMRAVFGRVFANLLDKSRQARHNPQQAHQIDRKALDTLTRLGREALAEHADWLLLHRERLLELPRLEI